MSAADWLARARSAAALISQGRTALQSVVKQVQDSGTALSTTDQAELDRILAAEVEESRAAHDELDAAISQAGG